jgi:hypothetical protein
MAQFPYQMEAPQRQVVLQAIQEVCSHRSWCLLADSPDRKRWARHGSTRFLWNPANVDAAMRYVIEEKGEPMALFVEPAR